MTDTHVQVSETELTSCCSCSNLYWHGCYGSGTKYNKYTIPESVKHPAKMSWELLERIFKHLESLKLLTPDSVVIDFMAGTGRTNAMAALRRYRTISVELEPHFIEMIAGYDCDGRSIDDFRIKPCACGSETLHNPHKIHTALIDVECSGNPVIYPVCRCGDKIHHKKHHIPGNRDLLEQVTGRKVKWDVIQGDARELSKLLGESGLVGVVSPPYFNAVAFHDKEFIKSIAEDKSQRYRDGRLKGHYGSPEANRRYAEKIMETFTPTAHQTTDYSTNPLNIGNIPDRPLVGVTSPPFEDSTIKKEFKTEGELEEFAKQQYVFKHGRSLEATKRFIEKNWRGYSDSENNIGNQQGESYLSAMLKVYQQAFICGISPLVVVTKNPTRNGKLRRLDLDTIFLLQACGYEIFDYHRAVLFESHRQETLDGDEKAVHKGRISFFKRLSLEKGTTVAQWEDVIFARIPEG